MGLSWMGMDSNEAEMESECDILHEYEYMFTLHHSHLPDSRKPFTEERKRYATQYRLHFLASDL